MAGSSTVTASLPLSVMASPLTVMAGHRAGHPWRHSAAADGRDRSMSDEASWVTGSELVIDGGMTAQ
jgi:NAD(P)-dependent dehydrogenase (short-subunit alcohol dehydrogenase family)